MNVKTKMAIGASALFLGISAQAQVAQGGCNSQSSTTCSSSDQQVGNVSPTSPAENSTSVSAQAGNSANANGAQVNPTINNNPQQEQSMGSTSQAIGANNQNSNSNAAGGAAIGNQSSNDNKSSVGNVASSSGGNNLSTGGSSSGGNTMTGGANTAAGGAGGAGGSVAGSGNSAQGQQQAATSTSNGGTQGQVATGGAGGKSASASSSNGTNAQGQSSTNSNKGGNTASTNNNSTGASTSAGGKSSSSSAGGRSSSSNGATGSGNSTTLQEGNTNTNVDARTLVIPAMVPATPPSSVGIGQVVVTTTACGPRRAIKSSTIVGTYFGFFSNEKIEQGVTDVLVDPVDANGKRLPRFDKEIDPDGTEHVYGMQFVLSSTVVAIAGARNFAMGGGAGLGPNGQIGGGSSASMSQLVTTIQPLECEVPRAVRPMLPIVPPVVPHING